MFTIQHLQPAGDAYLLWWDVRLHGGTYPHPDRITAYAGPIDYREIAALHDDPASAYDWELSDDPDELAALNAVAWGFPVFRYVRRGDQ